MSSSSPSSESAVPSLNGTSTNETTSNNLVVVVHEHHDHDENQKQKTLSHAECLLEASQLVTGIVMTSLKESGAASCERFVRLTNIMENLKMADDPFDVLVRVPDMDDVKWLLERHDIFKFLDQVLEEKALMPTTTIKNNDTRHQNNNCNWHQLLDRLIVDSKTEDEQFYWLKVLLCPLNHNIFKNIVRRNNMLLWSTMVVLHTVVKPHNKLPKDWRSYLCPLYDRAFLDFFVTPQMITHWAIKTKYVDDASYTFFRKRYVENYSHSYLDWEILHKHFQHVEEAEEKAKQDAIDEKKRLEEEKKQLAEQAEEALYEKAIIPLSLDVSPSSCVASIMDLKNIVHLSSNFDMVKCKSPKMSDYVMVGSFLYPFASLRDTRENMVEMNAVLRKNVYVMNGLHPLVQRIDKKRLEQMICDAVEVDFTIRVIYGTNYNLEIATTLLSEALQGCVFSAGQTLVPMRKSGDINYIEVTATNFKDDKTHIMARRIVPNTRMNFSVDPVHSKRISIKQLFAKTVCPFA